MLGQLSQHVLEIKHGYLALVARYAPRSAKDAVSKTTATLLTWWDDIFLVSDIPALPPGWRIPFKPAALIIIV